MPWTTHLMEEIEHTVIICKWPGLHLKNHLEVSSSSWGYPWISLDVLFHGQSQSMNDDWGEQPLKGKRPPISISIDKFHVNFHRGNPQPSPTGRPWSAPGDSRSSLRHLWSDGWGSLGLQPRAAGSHLPHQAQGAPVNAVVVKRDGDVGGGLQSSDRNTCIRTDIYIYIGILIYIYALIYIYIQIYD